MSSNKYHKMDKRARDKANAERSISKQERERKHYRGQKILIGKHHRKTNIVSRENKENRKGRTWNARIESWE